mgnify:CR=1 FL=1
MILSISLKRKKNLNISDIDSLSCKKCYKIIQQKEHPCHDCTNCLLKEGDFHEWHIFNKNFNRPFKLNDTMIVKDGRRLRFELAIDLSREESFKQSANMHAFREAVLNRCIENALHEKDPEKSINLILRYLGELFKADRAYFFELHGLH